MNYYFLRNKKIELIVFNKYTIDKNGVIINKRTEGIVSTHKNKAGYKLSTIVDDAGKKRTILIGRAIASMIGPPPTPFHTADHIDRDPNNDTIDNIRWASKKEQRENQVRSGRLKSALVIIKDGVEKTANEWVEHLKDEKNPFGREYTIWMIKQYAQKKHNGFSYKEYPDLPGEIWKEIVDSKTMQGRWEISNMNRVKYITKYAENVLFGERIGLILGYPSIAINRRNWKCHILAFKTFFPDDYATRKTNEMILHEDDDPYDFRPHKLRLGTRSENSTDAHANGCYTETKTERKTCASYINDVLEKEYDSYADVIRYLNEIGFDKAAYACIRSALSGDRKSGKPRTVYGRTWKIIDVK